MVFDLPLTDINEKILDWIQESPTLPSSACVTTTATPKEIQSEKGRKAIIDETQKILK